LQQVYFEQTFLSRLDCNEILDRWGGWHDLRSSLYQKLRLELVDAGGQPVRVSEITTEHDSPIIGTSDGVGLRPIGYARVGGNQWLAVVLANTAIDRISGEERIDVLVSLDLSPSGICLAVWQGGWADGNRILTCLVPLLNDGQGRNF
jgi:hypothetical protein